MRGFIENVMNKKMKIMWSVIIGLLTAAVLIVGLLLWKGTARNREYKEQMTLGSKYLQEMDYENAELCFRNAIEIAPKQAQSYISLATVYVETERYDEAEEVLNLALERIPEKETGKVEKIKEKLREVQTVAQKQEQELIDPLKIAMEVMGLPYLSDDTGILHFLKKENYNIGTTTVEQTGIISADLFDYDLDGQDEILVISMNGGDDTAGDVIIEMTILESGDSGQWSVGARKAFYQGPDSEVFSQFLYSSVVPVRIEFYEKHTEDHVYLYAEETGIAHYFSDGYGWYLYRYEYRDGEIIESGTPAGTMGSDETIDACLNLNTEYEYDQEYVRAFAAKVQDLEVNPKKLGIDDPISASDTSVRSLVRLSVTTDLDYGAAWAWRESNSAEPFGDLLLEITDFCNRDTTGVTAETPDAYQVEIVSYPENEDLKYPQLSPSSPSVDAWNEKFFQIAVETQKEENEWRMDDVPEADFTLNAEVVYQAGSVCSVRLERSSYTGGAHGSFSVYGKTVDLASDHEYTLPELLNTDAETAVRMVNDGFDKLISQEPDSFFVSESDLTVSDYEDFVGYYKTPEGIKVIGILYWLAPYSYGCPEILLQPVE